ncbi:Regulatory protein BlaR1 [Gimesia alba]|uniref:Regulatory protein BlaR1 n=1 Tax=Gimesia alba TaxID=2527973 RepID=A0A517RIK1_9PLAN|nr:M56 family metallopeptidase [Gimesia alba]QDT43690.1 Regulatory protein BlaR1 [Gimesia alba]
MLDWNQEFCVKLVLCFVHLLWQGLIIGAAFAILMGVLRNRSPQSRHACGLICLLIFALCVPVTYLTISDTVFPAPEVLTASGQTVPIVQPPAQETLPLAIETRPVINTGTSEELAPSEKPGLTVAKRPWDFRRAAPLLIAAYFVGVLFFASRLACGVYLSRVYRRLATPVTQPELIASIEKVTRQIGLTLQPPVMWCQQVGVPSVVGIMRPAVLLPLACLTQLKPEQLEQILFHELTHIRRYDHLFNLAQNTLEAVLFFHPVVWLISKRVRLEREFCCDAAVVAAGSHADEYANLLIDVAEIAKTVPTRVNPIAVSATGRESILGIRIERIMGFNRRPKDRLFETGSLITTAIVLGLFCLLAFQVPSIAEPAADRPASQEKNTVEKIAVTNAPKTETEVEQPKPAAPDEIVGIVIDEAGKPIEGVLVDAWTWWKGTETKTNKQGVFRLKPKSDGGRAEVRISKPGYSPHYIFQQACGGDILTVMLNNKTYIEGQLFDPSGKPVPDATVQGLQGPKQGNGVLIKEVKTATMTDAAGRYRMYVFPDTYEMRVSVPGVGVARVPNIVVDKNQAKSLDLQLKQGVRFEARVIDADTGKPVEQVVLWSWQNRSVFGKSDADGRIVIEGMLPGEYSFQVGYGKSQKINGVTGYFHGILGRWWSSDAVKEWQHKTIQQNGWQRNFDDLTFDLSIGMAPVTIVVEKGVEFSGKVLDPDGNPVAGATVAPAKSGSGNSLTGDTRYSVTTKDDGSYRVVMPAGNRFEYNLIAHDGKYQQWRNWANGVSQPVHSSPNEKFDHFNLTLTRPCTVKGRVVSASGRSVKGLRVGAQAADLLVNRYYDPTTKTNADGIFELKFIRPGENYIRVEPFHFIATSGLPGTWEKVNLKSGETYEDIELVIE